MHQSRGILVGMALTLAVRTSPLLGADQRIETRYVEHIETAAFGDISKRFAHVERVRLTGAKQESHIMLRDEFAALFTMSNKKPSESTDHVELEIIEVLKGDPAHNGRIRLSQRLRRSTWWRGPQTPGLYRLIATGPFEREVFLAYDDLREPRLLETLSEAPAGKLLSPPPAAEGDAWPRCEIWVAATDLPARTVIRREKLAAKQVFALHGWGWIDASDSQFEGSIAGCWTPQPIKAGSILRQDNLKQWCRVLVAADNISSGSVLRAATLMTVPVPRDDDGGGFVVYVRRLSEFDVSAWRAGRDLRAGDFFEPRDIQADILKTTVPLNPGDVIRREHLMIEEHKNWNSLAGYIPATRIDDVIGRRVTSKWWMSAQSCLTHDSVDLPPYRPSTAEPCRDEEALSEYRLRQPGLPPTGGAMAPARPKGATP